MIVTIMATYGIIKVALLQDNFLKYAQVTTTLCCSSLPRGNPFETLGLWPEMLTAPALVRQMCSRAGQLTGSHANPYRPLFPSWNCSQVGCQEWCAPTVHRIRWNPGSEGCPPVQWECVGLSPPCGPHLSLRVVVEAGVEERRHQRHVEDGRFAGVLPEDLSLSR